MKRFCLFLVLMLALCVPALAVPIENAESSCRVWIDGAETLVYETAVCNQHYWTANPELSSARWRLRRRRAPAAWRRSF